MEEQFFDSQELAQVKYEMLRRVRKEGAQVIQAASNFGLETIAPERRKEMLALPPPHKSDVVWPPKARPAGLHVRNVAQIGEGAS